MKLTTENTKEFIEFWNNNKPEKFVHPMYDGIASVILDYIDQAEYELTLENNKLTLFDKQTNEDLGEYTPEKLFWKARLLIESNDRDSRSSTNHYNNLLDIFADEKLNPEEYKSAIRKELHDYYLTDNFDINDELNWKSIDHTTKSWITVDGIYYEKEDSGLYLAEKYSITDLEDMYGDSFPEKAIEDGVLFKFNEYYQIDEHIAVSNDLKTHEEIEDLLYDYEYQTEDILKYYIPQLTDKQAEILDLIIYKQDIDIETIKELKKLSFENIYEEIDISLLSEEEKQALEEIKKELEKPHFEIEKQLFDSFIQLISTAAADSIKKNLESIKANAMYVYTNDGSEFSIISKRKSDNTYMVHKYYPENETGGIHHGSYDITTEKEAEKAAISKLIGMDSNEAVIELNNFIAGTREEEFNLELKNELTYVFEYLNKYSLNEKDKIELIDVKAYQYEGPSGKLKVLVEYKGNCREDDLFNLLHDDEENGQDRHEYEINGYKIDLNPIKAEKSGTISEYLAMLKNIEEKWPEVNKLINEQKENVMYKKIYSKDSVGYESWYEYDDKGNVIHFKNSNGDERWSEYDYKGNEIHSKNSDGEERWSEYDDKGNVIYFKDNKGFEKWTEYDNKGNQIHFKDSDGYETWYEYNDKGNLIHSKDSDGFETWTDYDDKGNLIHCKYSNGFETWQEYDSNGNNIHYKTSEGNERWSEYDDKGNQIHFKTSSGFEKWYEYDSNGNNIHYKTSDGVESWSTVEYLTKEQYLQEKIEQSKKEGYEAGYLFDNDESIISWNKLKKIDGIFSDANLIDVIDEIKESNKNLSEKELKEEVVFRVIEDNVDWHGFDHSLIENEQIDSGKLLDTRCYILEQVSESVVENKINSLENIQNKIDELLLKNSRSKDYFIMDCIKSEIEQDFDFWQEIDCNPEGSVDNTAGSYQFLAGISDEVAKKLGLTLRDEDEELNYQYEILGTYEMIPEKFTKDGHPFIRFDNREINFCCNISSDDESFMKQEIFSFDFYDSNYSFDILYKYFDKYVAAAMEQTQEYELFLNNPQAYVEKYVLENVKPMEIIEEISKEKSNTENDFRNMLFENMKTSKDPFEATFRIFEELKQKKDTERIQRFNKYLEDNNCKTKKGFERFFIEIIGLTKNDPQKKHKREFNGFHGIER